MKINLLQCFCSPIFIFIYFLTLICFRLEILSAQESYNKEPQIDSSTKFDDNASNLPTNPFELVDMIRRANSLNEATKPSEAIDDALKSFSMIEENQQL